MRRRLPTRRFRVLVAGIVVLGRLAASVGAKEQLVVHEWGTFTALQDDDGRPLGGINVDDEPVPLFVHNLSQRALGRSIGVPVKGGPRHPYVTLRLETPVVYFYPPEGRSTPLTLGVHVDFRGGWLTQFYPWAEAIAPGLKDKKFHFNTIGPTTVSSLNWTGLRVGTDGAIPETDEHVWTAPRQVRAARLTADSGESEQYLFYRGVGNRGAPLRGRQRYDGRYRRAARKLVRRPQSRTIRRNRADVAGRSTRRRADGVSHAAAGQRHGG